MALQAILQHGVLGRITQDERWIGVPQDAALALIGKRRIQVSVSTPREQHPQHGHVEIFVVALEREGHNAFPFETQSQVRGQRHGPFAKFSVGETAPRPARFVPRNVQRNPVGIALRAPQEVVEQAHSTAGRATQNRIRARSESAGP